MTDLMPFDQQVSVLSVLPSNKRRNHFLSVRLYVQYDCSYIFLSTFISVKLMIAGS